MAVSAEQSVIARAPYGVSEHDMPGGWVAIVCRTEITDVVYYHHSNDAQAWKNARAQMAADWFTMQLVKEEGWA